mgnify:CR=1 FL=1
MVEVKVERFLEKGKEGEDFPEVNWSEIPPSFWSEVKISIPPLPKSEVTYAASKFCPWWDLTIDAEVHDAEVAKKVLHGSMPPLDATYMSEFNEWEVLRLFYLTATQV